MRLLEKCNEEFIKTYGSASLATLYIVALFGFLILGGIATIQAMRISLDANLVGKYGYFSTISAAIGVFAMLFGLSFEFNLNHLATRERQKRIESKLDKLLEKRE